jgi:tetratricopeptide (TPR) repeat protein
MIPANPTEASGTGNRAIGLALRAAALVIVCLWAYAPAMRGGWIWDDDEEVVSNAVIRDPAGLTKLWRGPTGSDYFPLKTAFQWLEWHAWGDSTLGYHLASLALHVLSALLVWRLLSKLGIRSAWLGGLLFAVHPVAVESVAWIAELKNTLSLPPLLLSMCAYVDYDSGRDRRSLALSVAWFTASMLCKTSGVMLPVVLLAYVWWRRGRIVWRDLAPVSPFLAVSLALGAVTVWFQRQRAMGGMDLGIGGFWSRLMVSGRALLFYLSKCFVPVGLMPVYPRWNLGAFSPLQLLPWAVIAALAAWMWRNRAGWGRHALLGAVFFAANLAPVLGLVPMAYSRLSWVADHLAYISLIAVAGLAAAAMDAVLKPGRNRAAAWSVAALAVAALAGESRGYSAIFADNEAFWTYAASRNPGAWIAQSNLGLILYSKGQVPEAIDRYREALRIDPEADGTHVNLGNALAHSGMPAEAEAEYNAAIRIRPDNTDARTDLAALDLAAGRYGEAVEQYDRILEMRPMDPVALRSCAEAHYREANGLGNSGRVGDAEAQYREAVRLWPSFVEARANLGLALATQARWGDAIAELKDAVRVKPAYAEAHAYLGFALAGAGRLPEAIEQYEEALRIEPGAAEVHYNLAAALKAAGRSEEADLQFEEAARLGAGR